jgi:hypothetical protein
VDGGGALPAGTYAYRVVAQTPAGQNNVANSLPTAELSATLAQTGAVTVSWAAVPGAQNYVVYGRTPGAENVRWVTTSLFFTDTGAAGASGTPPTKATKWSVKNLFELKNAQRVLVDGNVIEYNWLAAQSGYAVVFTPRNQDGTAPWSVVQEVQFTHNVVRHVSSAINILGTDDIHPSQLTNNLVIANNLFEDVNSVTYGGQGQFVLISGGTLITIDHNTVFNNGSSTVYAYGTASTSFTFTNNIIPDNSWAIFGDAAGAGLGAIAKYFPSGVLLDGIYAGSDPSNYPTGNYYPTSMSAVGFVNLSGGNYRLASTSPYVAAAGDGTAVGCNIDALNAAAGTKY